MAGGEVQGAKVVRAFVCYAEAEVVEFRDLFGSALEGQHPATGLGPLAAGGVEAVGADAGRDAESEPIEQHVRPDMHGLVGGIVDVRQRRQPLQMPGIPAAVLERRIRGVGTEKDLEVAVLVVGRELVHDVEGVRASLVRGVGSSDGQGDGAASLGLVEGRKGLSSTEPESKS